MGLPLRLTTMCFVQLTLKYYNMKHFIPIKHGNHHWEKKNLVTVSSKKSSYDIMVCRGCGLVGKRTSLSHLEIDGRTSLNRIDNCKGYKREEQTNKQIRIKFCDAVGERFSNLTRGSVHRVIPTPKGEHSNNGVWVMGVGEPVKVLFEEFEYVTE